MDNVANRTDKSERIYILTPYADNEHN